jgi:hypothetical protein
MHHKLHVENAGLNLDLNRNSYLSGYDNALQRLATDVLGTNRSPLFALEGQMIRKLVPAKDIAERYSVTAKIVRKWARLGVLPVVKFNCRCVRFDVEKCDAAVERRTRCAGFVSTWAAVVLGGCLLPILIAIMATTWQPVPHQRKDTSLLNRCTALKPYRGFESLRLRCLHFYLAFLLDSSLFVRNANYSVAHIGAPFTVKICN